MTSLPPMTVQTAALPRQSALATALRPNRLLFALVLLHLGAATVIALILDVPLKSPAVPTLLRVLQSFVPLFVVLMLAQRVLYMALRVRPARPLHWLRDDLGAALADGGRLVQGISAFAAIALFAACFAFVKDTIPLMVPFSWDPAFARLDRALHGGQDAWHLFMPVFGTPGLTALLDNAYSLWFFLLYYFVFLAAFDTRNAERRMTFLAAFVLVWALGGNLLATIFSSVGPVYYAAFGYGADYAPLMDRLHDFALSQPLHALALQDTLLQGYFHDGPLKGISAMPSMHVATAWLMAFQGFRYNRLSGWAFVGFALVIQIGSVHLGWHYAIDGYFGLLLALGCWWLARRLARTLG